MAPASGLPRRGGVDNGYSGADRERDRGRRARSPPNGSERYLRRERVSRTRPRVVLLPRSPATMPMKMTIISASPVDARAEGTGLDRRPGRHG